VDIGIGLPTGIPGVASRDVIDWARRAERRGFSTVAAVDRLNDSLDPLTSLAAVAAATERIRLMTAALIVPRRAGVAELAQQVATLDRLSEGRLVLGVGLGNPFDYRASAVTAAGQRQRMETAVAGMRRIWSGEPGPDGVEIGPAIPGGGPVMIAGGHTDAALRRAAEYGGWLGGNVHPDGFAESADKVRRAWREAGRPGTPRLVYFHYFGLDADRTERYLRRFYRGLPEGFVDYSVQLASVGEEALRKAVADYAGAGCDEILLMPTAMTEPERVDQVADVLALGG
jgi:alkanesulfonate monooxygenase SsuD/methylene tetrahydromethanopterin reductase-like flavin-dependent oxidoreductase (luciferase family)